MAAPDACAGPAAMLAGELARLALRLSLDVSVDFDDVALARRVSEGPPTNFVTGLADFVGKTRIVEPAVPEPKLRRVR